MQNKKMYELTNPQKSIWLTEQYYSNTAINNICGSLLVKENLNVELFNLAINKFVENNDSFRLHFTLNDGTPYQYLVPNEFINFEVINLNNEKEIDQVAEKIVKVPFNFYDSRLFDFKIFKLKNGFGGFIVNVHHIISDAATLSFVGTEIADIYASLINNDEIPSKSFSYIDYINSEKDYLKSNRFEKDKEYWNNLLSPLPEVATIPSSKTEEDSPIARRMEFTFGKELLEKINAFCKENKISMYNFLIAIYSIYIGRINNMDVFTLGTPILNRTNFAEKHTSGMFISTSILKINTQNNPSFIEFAQNIAKDCMGMLRHQKYNYQYILEDLRKANKNLSNLYNIGLSYQITKATDSNISLPYSTKWHGTPFIANDLDINFHDNDNSGSLLIEYDYKICKYDSYDINNIHNRIVCIITQILNNPNCLINNISILTKEEENQILNNFNNTYLDYDKSTTIVDLFEKQVKNNPDNIAVIFEDEKIKYSELNKKANQFAHYILNNFDVQNSNIAILLNRNVNIYIAMLAVLKLGANYTLVDPKLPIDRIKYMIKNSNTSLLISDLEMSKELEFDNIVNFNNINANYKTTNLNIKINAESPCCVIYTSGSTGTPKGVILTHKGIVNMVNSYNKILKTDTLKSFLSISTVSFDMFAVETFVPLLNGKKVILTSNTEQNSPLEWQKLITENSIEFILTTPSKIELLLLDSINSNCLKNVKVIQLGGETFTNLLYNKLSKVTNANIFNGYGPTESTACCSTKNVSIDNISTIGKPFCNTNIYICDKTLNLLPVGIIGEICVSGDGVSLGYINNKEMTEKSFVHNNFNNSIMYKTGDLGKFNSSGELEYIGRRDNQVKLRGLRIELSEISNKINSIDGINNSVVVIKKVNGIDSLCAYISTSTNISVNKIKKCLKQFLPDYMIPNFYSFIDNIPLTLNGKVDFRKLPEISVKLTNNKEDLSNLSDIEIKIKNICEEFLNTSSLNINSNLFELGGDSLFAIKLATKLSSMFDIDLKVDKIFAYPTIKDLSNYIENESIKIKSIKINKAEKQPFYPLSSGQKRIYYACQKNNTSTAYNVAGAFVIDTILDKDKVQNAFNTIIKNNIAFRTYFRKVDGTPMQFILDDIDFKINCFKDKIDNPKKLIDTFSKPFNLEECPLLRVELHYLNNNQSAILIDSHHIILDGVSLDVFMKEFCNIYSGNTPSKNTIDYIDYSVWENNFNKSSDIIPIENYWLNKFKDISNPILNLPYDYANNINTFRANRINKIIPDDIFKKLEELSNINDCSPYMLFLSAFFILLYKYTGQNDIFVGSPISGRYSEEIQNIIGMFTNNIVLEEKIKDASSFRDILKQVKTTVLEALSNQPYPYDQLVEKLKLGNNNSLLDVMFVYQNISKNDFNINNHKIEGISSSNKFSKFNLLLEIQPSNNLLSFEYNTSLFKTDTITSLLEHYIFILNQIISNINIKITDIEIITDKEKQLLEKFNNTYVEPNNDTIISLFENQVKENKDNIALICNDWYMTYNQLNEKVNSLAHHLINKGIKNNDIVCIMTNRSFETIISMLAILKAGAAFFNVDPTYPIDRTNYYIEDSNVQFVLTQRSLRDLVSNIKNCIEIDLDNETIYSKHYDNPNIHHNPTDLSYIIYTSGSTGVPKGVMLNQIGFANMAKAMTLVLDYLKDGNKQTLLSVTSTPFDIFVYEIFVSLTHGLRVVMANNAEHRNPLLLENLIQKHSVTAMTVTPSLMKIIYDNRSSDAALSKVKNMVFGGEPLSEKFVKDLKNLASDITVYNIYGPSEITVLSNVQNLDGEKELTVGPPIMNTQMYILDPNMKQVPIGVKGEIYIAGIQVGLGYIGKPELTKERFLDNPFGPGKIYKSGDIGRWTFDGKIQCLGRIDHQVKLRGLRIELGEIEKQIELMKHVSCSVVNKVEVDGKEALCAYFVADKPIDNKKIKEHLRANLPAYMVPLYIMQLPEMPYTINRKIDRKALPIPTNVSTTQVSVDIKSLSSNEEKLLHIWKQILKTDSISINDNFFDIGGDSISAIDMQIEALKYGINFEYSDIFQTPTIKELANKSDKKSSKLDLDYVINYDYSNINKILANNSIDNLSSIEKYDFKNILLVGATGYLGVHLIKSFLETYTGKVYCLVREKNNISPEQRLKGLLEFYFGTKFFTNYKNRICILEGDLTKKDLGLSKEDYYTLSNNVDVVINSGALVKHYGAIETFETTNVKGTQNVVDFCVKEHKRLLHISTVSVSGNGMKSKDISLANQKIYKESNLYIGQNLDSVYAYTKFKAEMIVLNSILDGLDASILRIGNIASRCSDGMFQKNVEDNAFVKRFKSFIEIGAIPKYSLEHELEFTPVDLCADAVISILGYKSCCNVFHIYDTNLLPIKELLNILESIGIEITPISNRLMADVITGILEDNSRKDILSGIIYDLDENKNLIYTSDILLNADFTKKYLEKIGFKWKKINKSYIIKYMNYLRQTGFINF